MIHKPAETSQPILSQIRDRWSPRAFSDKPIPQEDLIALLEAARWAASSHNLQPWRFIVAISDDADAHAKMMSGILGGNQAWAYKAPVLITVLSETVGSDGEPNGSAVYDTGLAVGQLTIEAMNRGIYLHQMGGIDRDKLSEIYNIPDNYKVICCLALGYQGDDLDHLPDWAKEREIGNRERKSLSEITFANTFGETYGLVA